MKSPGRMTAARTVAVGLPWQQHAIDDGWTALRAAGCVWGLGARTRLNKSVFMNDHLNTDFYKVFRLEYKYDQMYSDLNTLWYSVFRNTHTIRAKDA